MDHFVFYISHNQTKSSYLLSESKILFQILWSKNPCDFKHLFIAQNFIYWLCEQTPLRGFANKKPPAYHCRVKIPPSILNPIHSVNHWKWILYSVLFSINSPENLIFSLMMVGITNIFDNDWWWWASISEIPSMPSLGGGMFYLWGDLETSPEVPISRSNWTTFYQTLISEDSAIQRLVQVSIF